MRESSKATDHSKTHSVAHSVESKEHQKGFVHKDIGREATHTLSSFLQGSQFPAPTLASALKNSAPAEHTSIIQALQRTHGNRYVQHLINAAKSESPCTDLCGSKAVAMKSSGSCSGCPFRGRE